ncbi:MAG TPA: nucleoside transporter C-terminal domain-containing protein [Terriglobales bacterium]|jgi:CNT family concentrative nucleoside transporter|nr:nucleoside transporter C-terminal domain-containing protein [Terriglobales bacterium]
MGRLTGLLGLITMLSLAYLFSTNRRAIRVRTVALGLVLQVLFAIFVLRFSFGHALLEWAGHGVEKFLEYSFAGSQMVFGQLGQKGGSLGMIFAFQVLPTVIFICAFFAVLYHYGVMQFIIRQMAKVMIRMGASGAESLDVAASIFMGQTEAPVTIRPYLPSLTRSELMTVMTAGMAHVSGGIMGAYILYGVDAKNLLSAVIMTAPGTILMAKMFVPETEEPVTSPHRQAESTAKTAVEIDAEAMPKDENVLGAITRGTIDGLHLALNIAAMLISFLALIALVNGIFGGIHNHLFRWFPSSLEQVFGVIFAPVAFVIGIPWKECGLVGNLLGTRMVINELVAYSMLGAQKAVLDPRSFAIATFALCGFANFSSIGIQIGGISALAPNKRGELAKLGFRAMIAGTMANLMSASIVGILLK